MKLISQCFLMVMIMLIAFNAFAKPGFIVTPFSKNITLAENSTENVLIVAQNNTGVNQTVTNVVPKIPSDSGIVGTVVANTCGLLTPGSSCEALVKLQSGNQPSSGNLNIAVCSFNGAYCSHIVRPIDFSNAQPVKIFIHPTNPVIANGTTQQFSAIGLFTNNTIQNVTNSVIWRSTDTSKVTISNTAGSQGLATGVGAGSSTISATLDAASDSTILTVTGATLTSITVTPVNPSIPNISTQQFIAVGIFSDNSHQDLTSIVAWRSSNAAVATISNIIGQKGFATTKSPGVTTISASFRGTSGSTTLNVTPAVLRSIAVTPTNPSLSLSNTQQFTATGLYSDNTVKDLTDVVTWSTQSTLVAIVSNQTGSKGTALGVGVGSTGVIAKLGNIAGATTLTVTPAVLTSITVTPVNPSVPNVSTGQFIATGIYSDNSHQDLTSQVTWISSNTNIATISNATGSNGQATTKNVGATTISAILGGVSGSTTLTVTAATLISITVTPTNPSVPNISTGQFTATGIYSDNSHQDLTSQVTWLSSNTTVAIISNATGSKGRATTKSVGATTITATLGGVSGSTTLTVTAATLTSITITPPNPSVPNQTTGQFTAIGIYSDNSHQDLTSQVTWLSSNPAVATISNATGSKGLASTHTVGTTTMFAILSGVSGSTVLTVTPAVLTSISVTPTNPSISISTTQQFTATGIYSDNSTQDLTNVVTWNTQSRSIAVISNAVGSQGKAVGVGAGSTSVIATLGTISGSTMLSVTSAVLIAIDIAPTNLTLAAGTEQQYIATGIYDNGRTQDITTSVTWRSSDPNIAIISNAQGSEGLAHGIQAGTVTISASTNGIVASTNLTVATPTLLTITVTPLTPTIPNGTQQQFIATGNYSDSSTQDLTQQVTWLSNTPSTAVISNASESKGLAFSVSPGSTTIRAAFSGVIGSTSLTVVPVTLTSIAVTPANASIPDGTTAQFTAIGTFSDASTKDLTNEVTWLSSNFFVATISNARLSKGLATAINRGSTTIRAIKSGVTGSTPLTVFTVNIGDSVQGGKIACLDGGLNNLIATNTSSSPLIWATPGFINALSLINGARNTAAIVAARGPSNTYAAGFCEQYEIDSTGHSPCLLGSTCYRDWFLPAAYQLSCLDKNKNQIGGFTPVDYWSSTEDPIFAITNALAIDFGAGPIIESDNKLEFSPVRCVRLINETL